ncbi:MAG: HAD family phosphatase [Erysipelothrix sp.]|nr:HAD family phosphatase [Erysipelothrix sp.]
MELAFDVIITDLDGTLLNKDKKISKRNQQVLLRLQAMGVKVIIASGRPRPELDGRQELLELEKYDGLVLSYNGARVVQVRDQKVVYNHSIPIDRAKEVVQLTRQFPVSTVIAHNQFSYVSDISVEKSKEEASVSDQVVIHEPYLEKILDFEPSKLLVTGKHDDLVELSLVLKKRFEHLDIMFSDKIFLEIMEIGVSKGSTLLSLCSDFGWDIQRVIAFGDNENDIDLLKTAGHGVAMKNAFDKVKSVAEEITLSNDEDGGAVCLEKHFGFSN